MLTIIRDSESSYYDYDPDIKYVKANFNELKGKTIKSIELNDGITKSDFGQLICTTHIINANHDFDINSLRPDEIIFNCTDGMQYIMAPKQDCRGDVFLEDTIGHLQDLIGVPLLMAEMVFDDINPTSDYSSISQEIEGWTFYKLASIKGYVTMRWYGTSNGYYSIDVDFERIERINHG